LLAAHGARADAPSSGLRWVSATKPPSAAAEETLPSPVVPQLSPREQEPPPSVGGDLADPPNLYEATAPDEEQTFDPGYDAPGYDDPAYGNPYEHEMRPPHSLRSRWLHHRPLASYLNNRPHQTPLQRDSWLNRPYAASFLFGGLFISNPQPNVKGDAGIIFGGRISWDFDRHWGVENRFAFAYPGLTDPTGVNDFRAANGFLWDLNWLWYWSGDTRWRPYFTAGLGALDLRYETPTVNQHTTTFTVPFGVGIKYRYSTRMAMRFDLVDNYSFAAGEQEAMHNISITAGFETHFGGGMRRSYWPYNPGHDWR
jgi:hypothetical protein